MLNDEDRKGIDLAREAIRSAILNQDSEAYALSFTEDGVVMHPDSPIVKGREALKSHVAEVFDTVLVTKIEFFPVVVEGNEDTAYEVSTQIVEAKPHSDQFKQERQHLHAYRKESDGVWRIAAAMSGNS